MIVRRSFFMVVLALSLTLSLALNIYLLGALQQIDASSRNGQESQVSGNALVRSKSTAIEPPQTVPAGAKEQRSEHQAEANILARIAALIADEQYFAATALLVELEQDRSQQARAVKVRWQQVIGSMIEAKNYAAAEDFLQAYLGSYPDDPAFLSLYVDFYLAKQQIELAVKQAYDIRYHVFEPQQKQGYLNSARNLVLDHADYLLQLHAWSALAAVGQQVMAVDPEFDQIRLLWAQAEYEQGLLASAENILGPLLSDPLWGAKAQALLDKIEFAYHRPAMIPLTRQGRHFIVAGRINKDADVSLLLDTGASISVLSQAAFEQIESETEIEFIEDLWLSTAGGRVRASIYQVARFEIRGYGVDNMRFAVNPYLSEKNDGLLGMNFLQHFDFYIDQTNNVLQLEYK